MGSKKQYAPLFESDSDEDKSTQLRKPISSSATPRTKPTCKPALFQPSADQGKKKKVYINVFNGAMPVCYMEWFDSESPIFNSHHPKYATYQVALDEWFRYCEMEHDHPADFVEGTLYNLPASNSTLTRPGILTLGCIPTSSSVTRSTLTEEHGVVNAVPSIYESAITEEPVSANSPPIPISLESDASNQSKQLDEVSCSPEKVRCWAVNTAEAGTNELVTGHWADRLFNNAARHNQDMVMREVKSMNKAKVWFSSLHNSEQELCLRWAVHTLQSNEIVSEDRAGEILAHGLRHSHEIIMREVSSVAEAQRWLDLIEKEADC
ncbi:hypothetical protein BT96DRAFT_1000929 [Gymnopus androsaceus JB14]|uniref:Uncharacterized protein n=1 Tax=Gymnopus androsaceus JB14 TaxID=1447944 RepID=A0A6A4H1F7_9AGAR|nr:hypothetical protein BT96DRAFT_1000929 [Gymnopus androsaceus JB14]